MRAAADEFHHRVRWHDLQGAAEWVVPERREPFLQAVLARGDERDLSISDYELEQARISEDGLTARVVCRIQWTRLPSVTEHSERVTSELVRRGSSWLIARQSGGPFIRELGEELRPAASSR